MPGYVYKRCPCPQRLDARGRKLACPKPHGSWGYKVDDDRLNGRRQQHTKSGFASKAEAQHAMAELVTQLTRGQFFSASKMPFNAYLDDWLAPWPPHPHQPKPAHGLV
jgi:hypothetical protein